MFSFRSPGNRILRLNFGQFGGRGHFPLGFGCGRLGRSGCRGCSLHFLLDGGQSLLRLYIQFLDLAGRLCLGGVAFHYLQMGGLFCPGQRLRGSNQSFVKLAGLLLDDLYLPLFALQFHFHLIQVILDLRAGLGLYPLSVGMSSKHNLGQLVFLVAQVIVQLVLQFGHANIRLLQLLLGPEDFILVGDQLHAVFYTEIFEILAPFRRCEFERLFPHPQPSNVIIIVSMW